MTPAPRSESTRPSRIPAASDIVCVAAGNSKVGMDFVMEGSVDAITFQSPEADGAIPMKLAIDWFNGQKIPR